MTAMQNPEYAQLIHHISRLEGQLASIKRDLVAHAVDCHKTATTLRAASRSFASLKHAVVRCFLEKKFLMTAQRRSVGDSVEYQALLDLIRS